MLRWKTVTLGDVAKVVGGSGFPKKYQGKSSGEYPFFKVSDMNSTGNEMLMRYSANYVTTQDLKSMKAKHYPMGTIIFPKIGGAISTNKKRLLTCDSVFDNNVMGVIPTQDIDSRYLHKIFQNLDLYDLSNKAALPSITKSAIEKIKIPLPPLPVQKQIIEKLDAAFANIDKAINATQKNIENAEALFQSHLNKVFETNDIEWAECQLNDICNIKHGFAFSGKDFGISDDETLPIVLTPGNYTEDGTLNFTYKNTKRLLTEVQNPWLLEVGSLTIVMTDLSSKMKLLGKSAFACSNNILHNQRIGLVEFKESFLVPGFLHYFFMSKKYLDMIKRTSTGSMVRHTAPKRILAANIRYPKEKALQENLTTELDSLFTQKNLLKQIYLKKVNELKLLKHSILNQAFSGELTKDAA